MLKIKLARIGKKKAPVYRFIISEAARDPYGRALENLGGYNPKTKELTAKADRINYWIEKGAQMTVTVNNLLVAHKIIKGEIIRVVSKQPAPVVKEEAKGEVKAEAPVVKEEVAPEAVETVEEAAPAVEPEAVEETVAAEVAEIPAEEVEEKEAE